MECELWLKDFGPGWKYIAPERPNRTVGLAPQIIEVQRLRPGDLRRAYSRGVPGFLPVWVTGGRVAAWGLLPGACRCWRSRAHQGGASASYVALVSGLRELCTA